MLQEWSEEKYMKEFKSLGTRQTPDAVDAADPELTTLAIQLSPHAYRLIRDQYQIACSVNVTYDITMDESSAEMRSHKDGNELAVHVVDTKTFQCSCTFMRTLLLPCRHVIYFRKHQNRESAIPPPKFYKSRWSLLSATNDISTGHLDVQRSLRTVTRDEKPQRVPSKEKNYRDARAVCQQIESIMAEQNAEDFQSTFSFLQTVEKLCRTGEVRKLADAIAVIGGQAPDAKKPRQEVGQVPASSQGNVTTLRFSQSVRKTQASRRKQTKAQRVQSLQRIRRRAKLIASCKTKNPQTLGELQLILSHLYCYALTAKTLELFPLKDVNVTASHTVQRMNVGQKIPQPAGMLPRDVCTAAISDIEMRGEEEEEGDAVYIARWDDFGYATVEQLKAMVLVIDARSAMPKVEATLEWIDTVEMCSSEDPMPFSDCALFPQEMLKDSVENMALNTYCDTGEDIEGVRLLKFSEKNWLDSTCVCAGLIFLMRHYDDMNVGFISPDWYGFDDGPTRKQAAATNGAFHASIRRQLGIVNVSGYHWIAFYLDLTTSPVTCTLFDPQQVDTSYKSLEEAIRAVIAPQLRGGSDVIFKRWGQCNQKDGHSCGVWSLFFLESMITGHVWRDECYKLEQFYRLRYLRFCLRDSEKV